ncbi:pseudouridine synthase [Stappia sp. F7233]|uniref:Pseudouridine synthase n=1 Tax=Stappia albiluteola TaxID=2758565 RepID=A0A839AIP1_9HYPH|nr:pseudouridine synthase [Stappia albiluteola]MBA5778995.1 pseudouridine synthase [Stappia albiluteola]
MTKDDTPKGPRGGKRPSHSSRNSAPRKPGPGRPQRTWSRDGAPEREPGRSDERGGKPAFAKHPRPERARPEREGGRFADRPRDERKPFVKRERPDRAKPARPRPAVAEVAQAVEKTSAYEGERIAKVMARAGLCSRRDAEEWIRAGRVSINGKVLETPAMTVAEGDTVLVDGEPLPLRERTRLWLFHKPRGVVTTSHDPEGRTTVFDRLPDDLPRVIAVGRLDINTEGLLLLTNDGGLARVLELPATGWLRRYRVRAFGKVTQADLDKLADGIAIDGVLYGAIEASLDKEQGDNVWLTLGLREGKNREVKRVLEHLGLAVNRLIRVSFGPFQLADLEEGEVREIRGRVLRDQLGERLAQEAGTDFEAPIVNEPVQAAPARGRAKDTRDRKPKPDAGWLSAKEGRAAVAGGRKKAAYRSDDTRGPRPRRDTRDGDDGARSERPRREGPKREGSREDRPQKVSPRSRFRLTKEPKPRSKPDFDRGPRTSRRRIWDEDGNLVEVQTTEAPKGKFPGKRGGPDRGGPDRGGRGGKR